MLLLQVDPILDFYKEIIDKASFDLRSILLYLLLSSVALIIFIFRFLIENKKRKKEIEILRERSMHEINIANDKMKLEMQERFQEMLLKDSEQYKAHISQELEENKRINALLIKERGTFSKRIELLEIELRYANMKIIENEKAKQTGIQLKYEVDKLNIEILNLREGIKSLENENKNLKEKLQVLSEDYDKRNLYIKELEIKIKVLEEKQTGELKNGRNNSSIN